MSAARFVECSLHVWVGHADSVREESDNPVRLAFLPPSVRGDPAVEAVVQHGSHVLGVAEAACGDQLREHVRHVEAARCGFVECGRCVTTARRVEKWGHLPRHSGASQRCQARASARGVLR